MWIKLLISVCHLAGALTSVPAIMGVRTAQVAIAWAVSLNTFPYVAVPAYWIFGRSKFHGCVTTRREGLARVEPVARQFHTNLIERNLIALPDRDHPVLVERLAKFPFTQGNDAELLVNGDATFKSIFDGISQATSDVLVQFFIIHDDSVGRELKSRLLERAKAGVRCLVLYDEIGSKLPRAYVEELAGAGVPALPFNTTQGKANRFQINFRNHRKIVIANGHEAWVGGLNVGDEYCTVVTANFDNRSFRLNFEITMAFADPDFAGQVAAMLENDFKEARTVRGDELSQRNFWYPG